MTRKHLPGPWFVSRDERPGMEWNNHIASVEHPHLEVCSMFHTKDRDGNERGEANARLVAAAPDMLEALECLLPGLVLDLRYADPDDDKEAMQSRITTVTDAIAKATESE